MKVLFKEILASPCGIRFMFDSLQLQSSCGRSRLLSSEMMCSETAIASSYSKLKGVYDVLCDSGRTNAGKLENLNHRLMCLHDITGTLARLNNGITLDDIDLFEIKYLALQASFITDIVNNLGLKGIDIPDTEKVISILDPDGLKIESFYVYDSYSKDLGRIRGELKRLQGFGDSGIAKSEEKEKRIAELSDKEQLLEGEIREELSGKLRKYSADLFCTIEKLSDLDIMIAKSLQIKKMGLCFPEVSNDGKTSYRRMFHPQIKDIYEQQNIAAGKTGIKKIFVPIDLSFGIEPVTIIGANMGGKTVVLKMAALNQYLFQFGFGVAAESATADIKENVAVCIGDEQNELSGLSSFAGEIKAVNRVLCSADKGERVLALIDEPARTTNPIEGTALVTALLNVLKNKKLSVLLTTHYNIKGDFFRRLRVNGLVDGRMDYTLRETKSGEIPHEAISIAESLNINKEWIAEAKKVLENKNIN